MRTQIELTCISDTHTMESEIIFKKGQRDILIHSGDATNIGSMNEICSFLDWFSEQEYNHKIFIPGNHDRGCESHNNMVKEICNRLNIIYLNEESVNVMGLKIYGSPYTPTFPRKGIWAFNADKGDEIKKHWDLIPQDTNILVTHGPPYGILDEVNNNMSTDIHQGCEELRKAVFKINPVLHVFGHIHEGNGTKVIDKTLFVNASVLDERYKYVNKPIKIILENGVFTGMSALDE